MKKALICGVSGQDGAYLARILIAKGHEVYGTSRDSSARHFTGLKVLGIGIFGKLDVQGYEARVLAGVEKVLTPTIGLQMEMSLAPLYEEQASFRELLDAMTRSDFDVYGFVPGFVDPGSGRMLQIDGVFSNEPDANSI